VGVKSLGATGIWVYREMEWRIVLLVYQELLGQGAKSCREWEMLSDGEEEAGQNPHTLSIA
jgi:hypothetical protein